MSNKYIVADPGGCIGCQTCMAACIMKHDVNGDVPVARLNLTKTLRVSAPIACHHCIDAPCVASCPTGALYEDKANDRVGVREEACIGCRGCVMACPFGAVDVISITKPVTVGNLVLGASTKAMVIKCDLCVDRENGPACVEFCPTKTLFLVDEDRLTGTIKDKRAMAAAAGEAYSSIALNPIDF